MKRVLVVDDHPAVRLLMRTIAEGLGLSVTEAEDVESARERVDATSPDLILLDLNLPGANGLEFVRRLRTDHWTGPVIIVTASELLPDDRLRASLGLVDWLVKPFDVAALRTRLRNVLGLDEGSPHGSA